ncbi:DUF3887 domain-containing protein [Sphingomonas sp. ASV193]|uniref:DUF3887 domain-containing protein n=1 Tax=Sphingomonas sp. ASV193 TaxID=3144405 RepID=UPI0032E8FAC2
MRKALLTASLLFVAACSPRADMAAGEKGVEAFHAALNAGKFDQIYASSDAEMKASTTTDAMRKLLDAIHRKLGNFESGKTVGWNDNSTTNGHFLTLNRNAQFERGTAKEQFVFRINGSHSTLAGYNINSNELITN